MSERDFERDDQVRELTPRQLVKWMEENPDLRLIDIREAFEWSLCRIEGAEWLPMNDIPSHLDELGKDETIVLYCHQGTRSAVMLNYLLQQGYGKAYHLVGGIEAWALDIDSEMPRY